MVSSHPHVLYFDYAKSNIQENALSALFCHSSPRAMADGFLTETSCYCQYAHEKVVPKVSLDVCRVVFVFGEMDKLGGPFSKSSVTTCETTDKLCKKKQ